MRIVALGRESAAQPPGQEKIAHGNAERVLRM
jgi:hypothetical protein